MFIRDKNDDILNSFKRSVNTFLERKNSMSFNCVYMKDNIAYIGADSRETMGFGNYNDNFQKLFINRKLKMIWSMTGVIKYKGLNYVNIVNEILNNSDMNIIDKLESIKIIMNAVTCHQYKECDLKEDVIFDLFVLTLENNKLRYYIFESKNGYTPHYGQQCFENFHIESSGVHTNMKNNISPLQLDTLQEREMVNEITCLIEDVIQASKKDPIQTVGGDIYVATMDNEGHINTYINGVEKEF